MDLKTCSICGNRIYPGHGSVFVKNNFKIFRFCRSKCRKLFLLKKNPYFLRWTKLSRSIRGRSLKINSKIFTGLTNSLSKKNNYNLYVTMQILFLCKKVEKIRYNRKIDFLNKSQQAISK